MYGMPTEDAYVGIIAQEIQEFAPYTITPYMQVDNEGNKIEYLSYDGTAITYMLVNAVQEQQEEIEEKANQILILEQNNKSLEARLNIIEAILFKNQDYATSKTYFAQ